MIKFVNLFFFAIMIVMNILANALPLNNKSTGELSHSLPNLFVPAGLTFSIWGVIYLLLAVFCLYQFKAASQAAVTLIGWIFAISCLLNAMWIFAWHYQKLPLSLLIMAGMLISLIYINIQIRDLPFGIAKAAFGIYLGWICIATIANVTVLLVHFNWSGSGISESVWTITMISIGALLVTVAILRLQNPFIGLSVIWAFIGIWIKRQDDYRTIAITAISALVIVGAFTILGFFRKSLGIFS